MVVTEAEVKARLSAEAVHRQMTDWLVTEFAEELRLILPPKCQTLEIRIGDSGRSALGCHHREIRNEQTAVQDSQESTGPVGSSN
jgi:hypothetical protein